MIVPLETFDTFPKIHYTSSVWLRNEVVVAPLLANQTCQTHIVINSEEIIINRVVKWDEFNLKSSNSI